MREFLWTNGMGIINGDKIWFVPSEYCCLCQYNYRTQEVLKFIYLEGATNMRGTHYSILKYLHYIVLIPTRDMNIFIYDIDTEDMQRITLKGKENTEEKFVAFAVWNQYIYMFPFVYSHILKLNMENMHLEYIESENIKECHIKGRNFTETCVVIGDVANLLLHNSNKICEYNMKEKSEKIFIVGDDNVCYKTMCRYKDNGIILSDQNGNIIILGEKKEQIIYVASEEKNYFSDCIPIMNGYLFIPYEKDGHYMFFDGSKQKTFNIGKKREKTIWSESWKYVAYSKAICDENMVGLFDICNKSLGMIDLKTGAYEEYYVELNSLDPSIAEKTYSHLIKDKVMVERKIDLLGLRGLINYCGKSDLRKNLPELVGERIYNEIVD